MVILFNGLLKLLVKGFRLIFVVVWGFFLVGIFLKRTASRIGYNIKVILRIIKTKIGLNKVQNKMVHLPGVVGTMLCTKQFVLNKDNCSINTVHRYHRNRNIHVNYTLHIHCVPQ